MERILPSYPLFVKDPFFSIWSSGEELNGSNVTIWTGAKKTLVGTVELDGENFVFLGNQENAKRIPQTHLNITAFTTDYIFENEKAKLFVSFVSPLPLKDKKTLSCPVCYINYKIEKKTAQTAKITLALNGDLCCNEDYPDKMVRGGIYKLSGFETAFIGLKRQAPASRAHDEQQADWGNFYLAGESAYYTQKPFADMEVNGASENWIVATNQKDKGKILIGFDDLVSIVYFGEYVRGYYFKDGKTIIDALVETWNTSQKIDRQLEREDRDWRQRAKAYGEEYLTVIYASLRQSIAAHKLVETAKGDILFLSKECGSNGCIGTVDVSYPSLPLYLLVDTEYVKGMMRPIFDFARMPVWNYDFAPHDVGTYPICNGQVYGLKLPESISEKGQGEFYAYPYTHPDIYLMPANINAFDFNRQMPVEECANMIIMAYACYYFDGDQTIIRKNYDLLSAWVKYLVKYGLKPENQLCTDDFAGHLKNNINLAIKATVAIGCFAEINKFMEKDYKTYRSTAKKFAREIEKFGAGFKHLPLTWDDTDESFSMKYNFAFDKVLKLNLFSQATFDKEIECYLQRICPFGVPLDMRKDFVKSDWTLWVTVLTNDIEKRRKLIAPVCEFLKKSEDRVPFSDLYNAKTGKYSWFKNRTTQGGCFMPLLLK